MILIAAWLVLCVLVGLWASKKGRSGFGFFLLAVIISPVVAGLIVLIIRPATVEPAQFILTGSGATIWSGHQTPAGFAERDAQIAVCGGQKASAQRAFCLRDGGRFHCISHGVSLP